MDLLNDSKVIITRDLIVNIRCNAPIQQQDNGVINII